MNKGYYIVTWLVLVCLKVAAQAGASNIEFVENKGQWDSRVKFRGEISTGSLYLEKGGCTVLLYHPDDLTRLSNERHGGKAGGVGKGGSHDGDSLRSHAYRMSFVGANDQVTIVPDKALPGYNNYFIGNDPAKWAGNCKVYQGVTYHDLYPGIDIRYYTNAGQLKYDLIVHPGADVSRIRMKYDGVDRLSTKKDQLVATTSVGAVTQLAPYSYTFDARRGRTDVRCRYVIRDGNTVSFDVEDHDASTTLIIDPTIIFCSFTGSKASNWGFTATPGPDGSFFAGGIVWAGYPFTTGALQPVWGGGSFDVGILKLSPNGQDKVYATFIGGSDSETPHSMITDAQGDLIVLGRTYSANFPFKSMAGSGGGADMFVVMINAAGNSMIGSIRIGGSGDDCVNTEDQVKSGNERAEDLIRNYGDDSRSEVILDGSNNILVAASTRSSAPTGTQGAFPIVGSVFQPNFGGGKQDAVVLKLDPKCTNLIWSSFLGGSGDDAAFVLRENPLTGDIYAAGATSSTNFPGDKSGVLQGTYNGGVCDGFVTQISADGTTQKKTTYLGTPEAEAIYGIQFDKQGFPYVMGTTNGVWPVLNVAYYNGGARQFVSKLKPDLSGYVFSTTFGTTSGLSHGNPNISPVAFLIDRCENIYVSGWGGWILGGETDPYGLLGSGGMPVTPDASKPFSDNRDFYFIVLQKNSSALLYGTFFGQNDNDKSISEHVDGGTSRYDQNGVIYQGICANCNGQASTRFPTTIGAWATVNGAGSIGCNEAAVKIAFNFAGVAAGLRASVNGRLYDTSGCVPLNTDLQDTIRNAKSYIWNFGDGTPDTATTSYEVFHTYNLPGTYTIMMIAIDSNSCNISDTTYRHVIGRTDRAIVDFTAIKDPNEPCTSLTYDYTNLSTAATKPFGPASFVWNFGDGSAPITDGTGPLVHTYQSAGTYIVDLFMVDTSYCNYPDTATVTLRVSPIAKAQFVTPATGCAPYTAIFNNTSLGGLQFYWNFGDGSAPDSDPNPIHVYPNPGTYTISLLEIDTTTCNKRDSTQFTITVNNYPTAAFTYTPETPVVNTPFVFSNESIGGASYKWLFGDGDSTVRTTTDTVEYLYNQTDSFQVCLLTTNTAGCTDTVCHAVDALINPLLDVPNAFTPGRFGQNGIVKVMGFGITHMNFRIYNRWGKLVFQSTDAAIGWDGTYLGQIQPMDVYAYTLEADFSNGTHIIKKGDITLIR